MKRNRIILITTMGILGNNLTYAQGKKDEPTKPFDNTNVFRIKNYRTVSPMLKDIKNEKFRKEQNKLRTKHYK